MFDLMFSAISAFNQVAVLGAALTCWGLGALLVGNAIYWRLHAVRIQGEVIGVCRNGNCLNAVYRYDSPAGETVEATSTEGSSSVRGKETGRLVPLWVMPGNPHQVQERGNHVFTVLGLMFLGGGAALFWFGATAWHTGPMTWVVGGLLLAHLLMKFRSIFVPRDRTLPPSGWRGLPARLRAARAADAAPLQRVEELSATPEFRDRELERHAQLARLAPWLMLAGVGMLGFGVYESRALVSLQASGIRTTGSVIALSSSRSSEGGITYYPLVSYCREDGRTITFRDSTGTNPPLYHVGEAVTVLYPPGEPSHAIIDRGPWNWLPAVILYALGAALVAWGLAARRGHRATDPLAAQS